MSPGARQLRDSERPDAGTAAHDVSVVGYDHTFMARPVHMATVRQPLDEIGRRAVKVLVQRIEALRRGDPYPGPFDLDLPTEIVVGETLAGPRRTRSAIA